jgi:hypothetical protein
MGTMRSSRLGCGEREGRVDLRRAASEELVGECPPEAAMAAGDKGDSAVDRRAL